MILTAMNTPKNMRRAKRRLWFGWMLALLLLNFGQSCDMQTEEGDRSEKDLVNQEAFGQLGQPLLAGGASIGSVAGGLFEAVKVLGPIKNVMELTGLDQFVLGEKTEMTKLNAMTKTLDLVKASVIESANALAQRQDDVIASLATVMTESERQSIAESMQFSASRIAPSDTSSMVLGYFFSSKVSSADKRANAKFFVKANPGARYQEEIERLHQKYDTDGYLAKAARAYALNAARKGTTDAAVEAFERLEEDYARLSVHEYSLILLFAASKALTGVTDLTDPESVAKAQKEAKAAKGDVEYFLPKWVERARGHQTAYLRAVASIAGILGSVYELNTWRDGVPSPISLFGEKMQRAAEESEKLTSLYDSGPLHLHKLILTRAVDAPAFKPSNGSASYMRMEDCLDWFNGLCTGARRRGGPRQLPFKVTSFEVDTKDAGNYAYFSNRNGEVHLTASGKWVVYDLQIEAPVPDVSRLLFQLSYKSDGVEYGFPTQWAHGTSDLINTALDARYMGESARLDKLPIHQSQNQFRNSWGRFAVDRTPGTVSLKTQVQAGQDSSAGADGYGRMDVVVDQQMTGFMWNSWRSEMHHVGFLSVDNEWHSNCEYCNDATRRVTTTHVARIANASFIELDHDRRDVQPQAGCTARESWSSSYMRDYRSSQQMFDERMMFNRFSSNDDVRHWTPRKVRVDLSPGKQEFLIQTGYNAKTLTLLENPLRRDYVNFLEVTVGIGGVNFFLSGRI
jgi:hypothetical protein